VIMMELINNIAINHGGVSCVWWSG
jgi:F0F1-type ATP synthase beta subunit